MGLNGGYLAAYQKKSHDLEKLNPIKSNFTSKTTIHSLTRTRKILKNAAKWLPMVNIPPYSLFCFIFEKNIVKESSGWTVIEVEAEQRACLSEIFHNLTAQMQSNQDNYHSWKSLYFPLPDMIDSRLLFLILKAETNTNSLRKQRTTPSNHNNPIKSGFVAHSVNSFHAWR